MCTGWTAGMRSCCTATHSDYLHDGHQHAAHNDHWGEH